MILSLFDLSGNWPAPYAGQGIPVLSCDIQKGVDVLSITPDWLASKGFLPDRIKGILAAPPCTEFTKAGAHLWPIKDATGRTASSVQLVRKTLEIISWCHGLAFWAIENPPGRLPALVPELCRYSPWYFEPWHFGDPWTKKTGLWGRFNYPRKTPVAPSGSWVFRFSGGTQHGKNQRSVTPPGFARAFALANPIISSGTPDSAIEQSCMSW
jgi:hypothetical protein